MRMSKLDMAEQLNDAIVSLSKCKNRGEIGVAAPFYEELHMATVHVENAVTHLRTLIGEDAIKEYLRRPREA